MQSVNMVLCWLGVFQSVLIAFYFLSAGRLSFSQVLLGFTMLMVGLRATKSTLFLFHSDVPLWVLNAGFAAHAAIGPLLLLFAKSIRPSFQWSHLNWFHFLPTVLILILSTQLSIANFWYQGGYGVLLYLTLAYIGLYIFQLFQLYQKREVADLLGSRWIWVLLGALTVFQLLYFSNYILRLTSYDTAPMVYSVMIYVISFIVIKDNKNFQAERQRKYQNLNLPPDALADYQQRIVQVMENQKPYLDPEFSLQKLAELTQLPPHQLSHTFSEKLRQNFTVFTNTYRIKEAERRLQDRTYDRLTIAAIAFDCGFNSISAFNGAFKKQKGVTPSTFKKDSISR
jgi:AraC-like DNA-binding protein